MSSSMNGPYALCHCLDMYDSISDSIDVIPFKPGMISMWIMRIVLVDWDPPILQYSYNV
jgi:hypothetical protein